MLISATHSSIPSLQASLTKTQLEQAQREADNAQAKVDTLQQQTDQAKAEEQATQQAMRSLSERAAQEDATYSRQLRGPRSAVPANTQAFLLRMYAATSSSFASNGNPLRSGAGLQAFVNSLGQTTGQIVDVSA